ncbi:hypothetical protein G6F58_012969 [Rhizopus delemar]|nr:hypothetical protein G6F58_012969 [Rhizopus delemar]
MEQDRPAADVRRERRLLRSHAAARSTVARRHGRPGRRVHRGHPRRIPRAHHRGGKGRHACASARRLRAGAACAYVRAVAVDQGRLGQFASVRPHLGAALPGAALRRRRT